ncbi:MAG: FAD/NAD(P)-binding protein [Trueperaceae bacterium]|nr:FAD/NAD(P)-binding protein [Trueperaceae bacterium]
MEPLHSTSQVPMLPMQPEPYRIERVHKDTGDTFTLELKPAAGNAGFAFKPGQFNMLYVFGVGEIPISISGDPEDTASLIHTTREVGTVTRAMRALKQADVLGIRGPFGSSWPVLEAKDQDIVLVAGGIGLAPLRPALYHVMNHRSDYGKVVLLYGARTPEDILYKKELAQWRSKFDLDVFVTVDRATGNWQGNVGFVTQLIKRAPFEARNTTAMICGPEVMMRFTAQELIKRGVAKEQVFVSMERNMKCGIGLCGHCQYGPHFICKDGPVFSYAEIAWLLNLWEV